jgi:exosome complex component RRP4
MSLQFVVTGDTLTDEPGFLMFSFLFFFNQIFRGHGTIAVEGKLIASLSGFVERVSKLISVRPVSHRYGGEVGDVIVGRVIEVADKKWKVNVHSKQHASLQLSAVHLPGGVQRRRTVEDQLQMREFFSEGDLICVR